MGESAALLRGWVRDGKLILESGKSLPEGSEIRVEVVPDSEKSPIPFSPEEAAEFAGWEILGDEAWAMIDWGEGKIARDSG